MGVPLNLFICPHTLDFSHVRDEVLVSSLVDPHCALAHPEFIPGCDDIEVSHDSALTRAPRHVLLEQRQVFLNEVLECFEDLAVVLGENVGVGIAYVGLELWRVFEACLHFCLVVMLSECIHETSNGVCYDGSVQLKSIRAWKLITFIFCDARFDWSEGKSADGCKFLSGLEIFLGVPVGLEDLYVTLDLLMVESVVFGQRGSELCRVLED